jgi:hypothetical protein
MVRIACTVMLKDEISLTEPFLRYHAALFGAENLYVFDNGTTDPTVLDILNAFEREGVHVNRSFTTAADFRGKGEIIGDLVKRLDADADYDFYVLLDCDEFVALRTEGGYTCDPEAIHRYLESWRGDQRILKVDTNLSNIPGQPGAFQAAEYSKTIFPRDVLGATDHGHHAGWTRAGASDFVPCDIVYVHFHFRPFDEVVRFARQKLAAEMPLEDLEDLEKLRNFTGRGWHLVNYVLGDEADYYSQFRGLSNIVRFPELLDRFKAIGSDAPYSDFIRPLDEPDDPTADADSGRSAGQWPFLVADEVSTERVRGWATDPTASVQSAFLRFLVDGVPVWEGTCDRPRPDVHASGHPTDRVGFDVRLPPAALQHDGPVLTATLGDGTPVRLFVQGLMSDEITLSPHPGQTELPAATEATPPHLIIDEASTARVRGWALAPAAPDEPVFLRFLLNGVAVWEGACTEPRPDVLKGGHSTDRVGFDFELPPGPMTQLGSTLTVEDRSGAPLAMSVGGQPRHDVALVAPVEPDDPVGPIYSHIDSLRNGRVQGWALRTVSAPEGQRLLGCCTVALIHQGQIVTHAVADIARPDVADAMQAEQRCGFIIDVPRLLLSAGRNPVFRLFIMPERQELTGSPCLLAPSFGASHG